MSEFLVGRLKSPRLARLSGTENAEKKEFQKLTLSQRKYQVFKSILKAKTTVMMDPVAIGLSLSFLYFSYTMLQLQMEVIGLYLVVALRLMPIVQSILTQIQAIQGSLGSVEALETRFNAMKKSVEKDMGKISLNALKQSISFNNVFFCYQAGLNDSLKNINIEFNVNKITAVVGPSGSGKSTLIDLLPRLRSPTKGFIHVDGVNINNFTLRSVRQLISYAPQFPQIFNGTVKSHILYGKINATNEEVLEAAHLAGAESFIDKLPNGFDTILGDDAVKLSGGQRQRLDLARALVRKAPILIFDEPTSNLDAESEEIFKQVLGEIRKETNTTIIIVSHRLASIIDADKIIVLNQGKVEMSGVHSKLLSQDGWYAKAWNAQLSK
jgi:ABC-type multidrug transport system fused ATPase/permease subunit